MKLPNSIFQFSFFFFLLLFATNCGTSSSIFDEQTEGEIAANLLINNRGVAAFKRAFKTIDDSQFIVISLEKIIAEASQKTKIELTYDRGAKQWIVTYSSQDFAVPDIEQIRNRENLTPKSGWVNLIERLEENNILSKLETDLIEHDGNLSDSESYILTIRIADRLNKCSMEDPAYYAAQYPENLDFANFSRIVNLLNEEFMNELVLR